MLNGIDVSHFQGLVDWPAVRGAGHAFAFCKATEGTGFRDTRFVQNWPAMKAAGLTRGAYHFLRTSDPAAQARHFVNTVGDFRDALAVVDVETAGDGSKPTIFHVRGFATEFKRLVPGHPLIVYTGHWYWVGNIGNPHGADIGPLWHSEYEPSPISGPDLDRYGGWAGATFWQWTSTGNCPGVNGNCDLNVFYGTHADLARLTGTHPTPTPIPSVEDTMPFPVIGAATDSADRPWTALLPGKLIRFVDWDPLPESTPDHQWAPGWAYHSGVEAGLYLPMKRMSSDENYDEACAAAQQYSRLP